MYHTHYMILLRLLCKRASPLVISRDLMGKQMNQISNMFYIIGVAAMSLQAVREG